MIDDILSPQIMNNNELTALQRKVCNSYQPSVLEIVTFAQKLYLLQNYFDIQFINRNF